MRGGLGVTWLMLAAMTAWGPRDRRPGCRTAFNRPTPPGSSGSPDPLPLEAVRAFPQLTFERPVELTAANDGSRRNFVVGNRRGGSSSLMIATMRTGR